MAYTVKKLAQLSGVSVRTLHFYDEIDLLKPAFYGENGYRYYEEQQLLLLQQILFYRELDMPLSEIKKVLTSTSFNIIETLDSHKNILMSELDRKKELINTIDKTIKHLRGKQTMKHAEFYDGFDAEKQAKYEQDLIDSGWVSEDEITKSRDTIKKWKKQDWDKFKKDSDTLHKDFVKSLEDGMQPDANKVQELLDKHFKLILEPFWTPNKERYLGLAELYQTPEFAKFYQQYHPKLLDFLVKGMKIYAKNKLK